MLDVVDGECDGRVVGVEVCGSGGWGSKRLAVLVSLDEWVV